MDDDQLMNAFCEVVPGAAPPVTVVTAMNGESPQRSVGEGDAFERLDVPDEHGRLARLVGAQQYAPLLDVQILTVPTS